MENVPQFKKINGKTFHLASPPVTKTEVISKQKNAKKLDYLTRVFKIGNQYYLYINRNEAKRTKKLNALLKRGKEIMAKEKAKMKSSKKKVVRKTTAKKK